MTASAPLDAPARLGGFVTSSSKVPSDEAVPGAVLRERKCVGQPALNQAGLFHYRRAECHEPHKGGSGRRGGSDVASITTVDHDSSETPFEDWGAITSPRGTATVFPGDGRSESDPSVMLGLVLVLVANTVVVAALVAAVVWILA